MSLIDRHIERLVEDGRSIKTLDTYRYDARKLAKLFGGVRVGEASPARLDAALRSMRTAHGPTMATSAHIWMTLCVRCYGSGASSSVMISTVTESARNDLAAFLDLVEDKAAHYGQRRQERLAGAGASSSR
jgi:hypothetical protein